MKHLQIFMVDEWNGKRHMIELCELTQEEIDQQSFAEPFRIKYNDMDHKMINAWEDVEKLYWIPVIENIKDHQ